MLRGVRRLLRKQIAFIQNIAGAIAMNFCKFSSLLLLILFGLQACGDSQNINDERIGRGLDDFSEMTGAYASLIDIGGCHKAFSVIAFKDDAMCGADAPNSGERLLIHFSNTAEGAYRIGDAGELSSESSFSQNIASVSFINRAGIKVYSSVSGTIRVIGNIDSGDDIILQADIMTNAREDICIFCKSDGKCVCSEQKDFIPQADDDSCDVLRAKSAPVPFKAELRAKRCAASDTAIPFDPEICAVK